MISARLGSLALADNAPGEDDRGASRYRVPCEGEGGGEARCNSIFGCKGRDEVYLILQKVQDGWGQPLLLLLLRTFDFVPNTRRAGLPCGRYQPRERHTFWILDRRERRLAHRGTVRRREPCGSPRSEIPAQPSGRRGRACSDVQARLTQLRHSTRCKLMHTGQNRSYNTHAPSF